MKYRYSPIDSDKFASAFLFDDAIELEKERDKPPLKCLIYGEPGTGKTYFATMNEEDGGFPDTKYLFDLELGSTFLAREFNHRFKVLRPRSEVRINELILSQLEFLKKRDDCKTIILDSISVFENFLKQERLEFRRSGGKSGRRDPFATIAIADHAPKNLDIFNLMRELIWCDCSVIITAQSANLWKDMEVIGKKANCSEEVHYWFDYILHFKFSEPNLYYCIVEKCRSGIFKKGDIIEFPTYKKLVEGVKHERKNKPLSSQSEEQ
ncbi:MAG TPA: hypothetical protein EYP30_02380 [Archaeoglobaceae archaeon]|nr:hypothetical protein [Archaeoglobaceae archaeon]